MHELRDHFMPAWLLDRENNHRHFVGNSHEFLTTLTEVQMLDRRTKSVLDQIVEFQFHRRIIENLGVLCLSQDYLQLRLQDYSNIARALRCILRTNDLLDSLFTSDYFNRFFLINLQLLPLYVLFIRTVISFGPPTPLRHQAYVIFGVGF